MSDPEDWERRARAAEDALRSIVDLAEQAEGDFENNLAFHAAVTIARRRLEDAEAGRHPRPFDPELVKRMTEVRPDGSWPRLDIGIEPPDSTEARNDFAVFAERENVVHVGTERDGISFRLIDQERPDGSRPFLRLESGQLDMGCGCGWHGSWPADYDTEEALWVTSRDHDCPLR